MSSEISFDYKDPQRIIAEANNIKFLYDKRDIVKSLPDGKLKIFHKTYPGREEYVLTKYRNGRIVIQEFYEIFTKVNRTSKIYVNKSDPEKSTAKGIEIIDGKPEWTFFKQPEFPSVKAFNFLKGGYIFYNATGYKMRNVLAKGYGPVEKKLRGMGYEPVITATMGGPHSSYSAHWYGLAVDIVLDRRVTKDGKTKYVPVKAELAQKIAQKLTKYLGGKYEGRGWYYLGDNLYLFDEYNWISPHRTAPHFHIEYVPPGAKSIKGVYIPRCCEDLPGEYKPIKKLKDH